MRIIFPCQSLESLTLSLQFSFSLWNQGRLLGEVRAAAYSCSLRGHAYNPDSHPCLLRRHPGCRRVSTAVIQGYASLRFSSLGSFSILFMCHAWLTLCFDPHQFLFLKCPSTRPEILSILKDGQSPASFRKLFLIYLTGIDPSLLSILIFISVPSFPSLISQAPVFSPHCPACRSCSVNIWWSIPWAYLRCVLHALHLSETTRLLLSKLVTLHSLEHWQTF